MQVLLDTNVVLDALLEREPWRTDAEAIWRAHDEGRIDAFVTSSSVTDVFYVARRFMGKDLAWASVGILIDQLHILAVGTPHLRAALAGDGDFEDQLQIACARLFELDFVVTRDPTGFVSSNTPVIDPASLVARLNLEI